MIMRVYWLLYLAFRSFTEINFNFLHVLTSVFNLLSVLAIPLFLLFKDSIVRLLMVMLGGFRLHLAAKTELIVVLGHICVNVS